MEQHPIPQDVTGFQFKLIGTMTVKQFGFVAAGVIGAVILWYLPAQVGSIPWLIKSLLIIPVGVSGVIIAFVPIEGRPADVMASNFIKALFAPNQYVYKRHGRKFSFSKITTVAPAVAQQQAAAQAALEAKQKVQDTRGARLEAVLYRSTESQVRNKLDEREQEFFKKFSSLTTPTQPAPTAAPAAAKIPSAAPVHADAAPQPVATPAAAPTQATAVAQVAAAPTAATPAPATSVAPMQSTASTSPSDEHKSAEELGKEEASLEQQLTVAKQEETKASPTELNTAHQKMLDLEKKIKEIHEQKLQAEKELQDAKEQLAQAKQEPLGSLASAEATAERGPASSATASAPAEAKTEAAAQPTDSNAPHVRVVPQSAQQNAGLPHIPDTPNVVVGIVKDPRGNVLSNILVEIKDKDNNPVRAFKTNALGHFASATPLATGIYTIELEDPKKQNRFDVIQLVANNQILLPLEILSHDAREELRKQLFN